MGSGDLVEVEGSKASSGEGVMKLEDAVELLVVSALPLGKVIDREEALWRETQEAVARQVSKLVLDTYIPPFCGL